MRFGLIGSSCFIIAIACVQCTGAGSPSQVKYSHAGWDTLDLGGWTIQAPPGYEVKFLQGVDSDPGNITSQIDSVQIEFDVCPEFTTKDQDCNNDVLAKKASNNLKWCQDFYHAGTEHLVWVDTVNGRYVVMTKPVKTGHGTTSIHFSECGSSMGMTAVDLNLEQEKIVLEMFATIDKPSK